MRIGCSTCGKVVSTEVPGRTIIRAYVECPECIEEETMIDNDTREVVKEKLMERIRKAITNQGLKTAVSAFRDFCLALQIELETEVLRKKIKPDPAEEK